MELIRFILQFHVSLESVRSDCLSARDHYRNVNIEHIGNVDPAQALTLNDVSVLARGDSLPIYDAMVLHGDEKEDQRFAEDLIERLEKVGLNGKTISSRID